MTRRPRALVVGGSLGGLFAANVLREVCAWDADVFERVENDLAAHRCPFLSRDGAVPRPVDCGRMYAMTDRPPTPKRPQCCSAMRPTAKASAHENT